MQKGWPGLLRMIYYRVDAMVGVLEQLPPETLFITGSTQQPVLARFRQYTRELFTAAYILAAAEDKESLLAAETEANAYGIASGRSLNPWCGGRRR